MGTKNGEILADDDQVSKKNNTIKPFGHTSTIQGRNTLSALLHAKKRTVGLCNQDEGSPQGSSLERIVRHSGSDTYAGSLQKIRQMDFSSNAPKNVNCTICQQRLSKLYISECGHMACLQCWQQWLDRSNTCPQCRKPTSIKSIALAVFKGEI